MGAGQAGHAGKTVSNRASGIPPGVQFSVSCEVAEDVLMCQTGCSPQLTVHSFSASYCDDVSLAAETASGNARRQAVQRMVGREL